MKLRAHRVFLDNNAVGSLFTPRQGRTSDDLYRLRATLRQRVISGAMVVVVSADVLEEFAPVHHRDSDLYARTLDYLQGDLSSRLILTTDLLVKAEVRVGRRLRFDECLFDRETTLGLWSVARTPEALGKVVHHLNETKDRYLARARRQLARAHEVYTERKLGETIARGGPIPKLEEVTHVWGKRELRGQIDEWSRETLASMATEGRLPATAKTLEPSAVPTLRYMAAYYMAKIARNVSKQAAIRGSDAYDFQHYVAARYTDLLVCDDAEFKRTAALIDETFPIKTLDEFRGALDRGRCGPVAEEGWAIRGSR